jgi:hypothetical protein
MRILVIERHLPREKMPITTRKTNDPPRFDPAVLQTLQDPLSVRVEKVKGAHGTPVELPAKDGFAPGFGWTKEEITKLENWLLTEFTGGGLYHIIIVDAAGNKMEWFSNYDTRFYPERVPPNQASAFVPPNASNHNQQVMIMGQNPNQPQQPAQQQNFAPVGSSPTAFPPPASSLYGPPPMMAQQQQLPQIQPQQQQQPQQGQWGQMGQMGMGQPGMSQHGLPFGLPQGPYSRRPAFDDDDFDVRRRSARPSWTDEAEKRREEERRDEERRKYEAELKRREEELHRLEAEKREQAYKSELDRQQQQHSRELEALKQEIRASSESRKSEENTEIRREREARELAERQAREERDRAERERERERSDARFKELQDAIAKVMEAKRAGDDDPKVRILEEEIRRTRDEALRARESAEKEAQRARDEALRERERIERERDQDRMRMEMEKTREETKAAIAASQANKADPMLEMMRENARVQAESARAQSETVKEVARLQQMSADRMAGMMMTPQSMVTLMRDANGGTDAMLKNMTSAFGSVFDVMKNAVSSVAGLQQGPSEPVAARLIQEGLGRASEMAEKYLTVKHAQSQNEAQVKMHQAEAQRAAAMAQAEVARARATQMEGQNAAASAARATQAAAVAAAAPPVAPSNGANGANGANGQSAGLAGAETSAPEPVIVKPVAAKPGRRKKVAEPPIMNDTGTTDPKTGQTVAQPKPPTRAEVDEALFGALLDSVKKLRIGVKVFLENLKKDPPVLDDKGNPIGLTPDLAIDAILQGVNKSIQYGVKVPAFDLLKEGRYAELMDLMLPEATQPYRDECVKILSEEVEAKSPDGIVVSPAAVDDTGDDDEATT